MVDRPDDRTPDEWRRMAEQTRKMAEGIPTDATRQKILDIAKNYERLAKEAESEQERRRNS